MAKENTTPEQDIEAELILKDADEALRQDALKSLWDEWGSTIIGIALMIIFGTMIGTGWRGWQDSIHTKGTAAVLQSSNDVSGSYKGIRNLMNVSEIARAQSPALIYNLMAEAANSGLPREWDILAEWGEYRTQADLEEADKLSVAQKMEKLAAKNDNPYSPAILMESAILYGENGNIEKAISLLEKAQEMPATSVIPQLQATLASLLTFYKSEKTAS